MPDAHREAIIGDLIEEHALHSESTRHASATCWYWCQVSRSILPLVRTAARRERWAGMVAVAFAAYVLATIVESVGEIASSRLLAGRPSAHALAGLIVGLTAMTFGGYVATWMRHGAATVLAALIALVVLGLMSTKSDSVPLWYQIGFLVLGPLASLAGGALFRRRPCERAFS